MAAGYSRRAAEREHSWPRRTLASSEFRLLRDPRAALRALLPLPGSLAASSRFVVIFQIVHEMTNILCM
ncbi:hypothetical protein NDU88_003161 [Pleurodeles waltl]|uniref:Uncharacterized protein n=1 Tax=Pleurodeles waltl TaxID=8319 RepID=A0AAV7LEG6_PLEWA|nr:hypothetical protein NDU88_003161 [Pleurodeles waltl]